MVLILTGIAYAIIGVKNRWIHVFLSTAYLASLAVVVLIVYVCKPPVSDAIQGAYFVGILMSGLIFGGGALVFKDITEGLGCLLGGFCLSMWFLTLKSGGLITSTGGKAIFIAAFCVVCWSLSFSHYTRDYSLIFSTAFGGATSLVLGIDCFSRGGLKEFWVYIWALNDDLFPLDTNTYPITRGIRVEIAIIVLGTIIGVISQIRLWKMVKDKKQKREAAMAEDDRRRDAVEEALGRHLERQNDRDRGEWEKRYGDRLNAKRNTVLWSEVHNGEKDFPSSSTTEVGSGPNSESNESLEMAAMPVNHNRSLYSSKNKRQSAISVQPIQEVEEEEAFTEKRLKHDSVLGEARNTDLLPQMDFVEHRLEQATSKSPRMEQLELSRTLSKESLSNKELPQSLKPQNQKPPSRRTATRLQSNEGESVLKKKSSLEMLGDFKRRSFQSLRSKNSMGADKPVEDDFSESREALVKGTACSSAHSRASSLAATLDDDNEKPELPPLDVEVSTKRYNRPPQIVISPSIDLDFDKQLSASLPPSPSALSESFEADPEALVRPSAVKAHGYDIASSGDGHSSGPILTKDALDRVPSQLSNVVLSYRTNEWAKHIDTAEVPVFEEPEPIHTHDEELPTHLAIVQPLAGIAVGNPSASPKSPTLPSPITSVAPSETGVKVNPDISAAVSVPSRPQSEAEHGAVLAEHASSSTVPSREPSQTGTISQQPRSPIDSAHTPSTDVAVTEQKQQARRISNPIQRQTSTIQHSTIDENTATNFAPQVYGPIRASSNSTSVRGYQSPYMQQSASQVDLSRSTSNRSSPQPYPSAFTRNPSMTVHDRVTSPVDNRPATAHSGSPYSSQNLTALRSETRLDNYHSRSHQPLQRNNTSESRRENLMADWRMQLAQSHSTNVVPRATMDNQYSQQMMNFEVDKLRKEQQRHTRARQEAVIDQSMRTQGMIDAHKEVLKRMQSKANEKLDNKKAA